MKTIISQAMLGLAVYLFSGHAVYFSVYLTINEDFGVYCRDLQYTDQINS